MAENRKQKKVESTGSSMVHIAPTRPTKTLRAQRHMRLTDNLAKVAGNRGRGRGRGHGRNQSHVDSREKTFRAKQAGGQTILLKC